VLPAYFKATRAATGGAVTGLFLVEPKPDVWRIMLESRGSLQTGETISLLDDAHLKLLERIGGGEWLVSLHADIDTLSLLDRIGATPLPAYIRKARRDLQLPEIEDADRHRYNTVYAQHQGSVAAPTAGLHFTPQLLTALSAAGIDSAFVTLHVGLGTFAPIRTETIEDHPIHAEWISVPAATIAAIRTARQAGGRVIPIGTTTVRSLESLPDPLPEGDYVSSTDLFITDGSFQFRFTDSLMTNFHLPKSTLLAMVAALPGVGIDRLKQWYGCAIDHDYRFYSYGDAMLLL
jgi:S-adenosylmethionine:tRNA ribosyltransferase-isomerase